MIKEIDFMKWKIKTLVISLILCIISIFLLITKGLNLGIDFTGGILLQMKFNNPQPIEYIREKIDKPLKQYELQRIFPGDTFIIRLKTTIEEIETVKHAIASSFDPEVQVIFERAEYVGPKIGEFIKQQSLRAIILSLIAILIYIGIRFKSLVWGIGGVTALAHDVILSLGFVSLFQKEVNVTLVAAILTLAGYSINDTIVIFDRIRELMKLHMGYAIEKSINAGINQSLKRTIITSLTTILVLLVLFIVGGTPIKDFATVLLFGVIVGTYSSIFVASPIVTLLHKKK